LTRRQKEIFDYIKTHIESLGYAPSIMEIARRFGLSSLATVHKHLVNLQKKGLLRRSWNRSRALEIAPDMHGRTAPLPLLGRVAAGAPIDAIANQETIEVPTSWQGARGTYVLQVRGDSMIDEQIRDGDFVIVENRQSARNGEMVIALLNGDQATLKKFYLEPNGDVRLQPANPTMQPILVPADVVRIQGVVIGIMRKY
ncbi:MAG: transcriptional repressor LexA, partial [Vicinamibacteria bacterium]|nr:transcriptional repressor LexA [Vicinamibacteria bacterium]